MFDYSIAHWTTFLFAAILLNIAPGPDMAFIISHTVKGGKGSGFAAMLGIWSGAFAHVLFAAAGLSAIIVASATLYSVVKWTGVVYLFWLGIQAIMSNGGGEERFDETACVSKRSVFCQGFFIDLLNPKVATFFLAFLPQFVVQGAGPVWMQLMLHGTLIILVAAFIEPPLILLGERVTDRLRRSRSLRAWLDRVLGGVLITLGLKLAVSER